jgi:hypothetical protein
MAPPRTLLAAGATCLTLAGCLGGTPVSAQVKDAARSWAAARLHARVLQVTLISVAPDKRRARVHLVADGARYRLRLRSAKGQWRVVATRRR